MEEELFENFNLKNIHGLLVDPQISKPQDIWDIQKMTVRDDDIIAAAYPKCGITWTEYIIWGILHRGAVPPSFKDMNLKHFPFMELTGIAPLKNMQSPRTIKFHSPYHLTPKNPNAKFIVVFRNPFDCCVSYFHHMKQRYYVTLGKVMTFDRFFELFLTGEVVFGDYFDFLLSWYERRNDPNVLFLFFEQMKKDHEGTILKIADFLGPKYSEEVRGNPDLMEKIVFHSSFKYMKENVELDKFISVDNKSSETKVEFFRKGEVGDWRRLFSEDQKKRLLKKFDQKLEVIAMKDWFLPPPP